MPPKGSITRKGRTSYLIFSLAIEANPGATHQYIYDWVSAQKEHWAEALGWELPQFSRSRDYIRQILSARSWMDSDWHLGAFAASQAHAQDIPVESVPDVLMVALRAYAGGVRLTVRQAWWVARLRGLLGPIESCGDPQVEDVYSLALAYASSERAATALSREAGIPELQVPGFKEFDTWPLDVLVSMTESTVLPGENLYEVLLEAEFMNETVWPGGIRMKLRPMSPAVAPLHALLLEEVPALQSSCRATTSALLWLRAYAEQKVEFTRQSYPRNEPVDEAASRLRIRSAITDEERQEAITASFASVPLVLKEATKSAPEWDSLTDDEKKDKAREIGNRVLESIEQQKETDSDK
jgi:hypothetical protein